MYKKIWELIENSHYIALVSHINPDGDTLGSSLAFYPILKEMKKNTTLVNTTKDISRKFDFLPNFNKIKKELPKECELVISFDCGSFDRLNIKKGNYKIINIDHHTSNTNYGDINIVDANYASSTMVVKDILEYKSKITKEQAICIYTGIVEDTGFFTFSNTDKKAFDYASNLLDLGVDPAGVAKKLTMRNSLAKIRLTSYFIDSLQLLKNAEIAVGYITKKDFIKSGATRSDSEHLVDILKSLATVKLAILILEEINGNFKISLRSKSSIDVSKIAQSFGGGGHKNAAGFEIKREKASVILDKILRKVTL